MGISSFGMRQGWAIQPISLNNILLSLFDGGLLSAHIKHMLPSPAVDYRSLTPPKTLCLPSLLQRGPCGMQLEVIGIHEGGPGFVGLVLGPWVCCFRLLESAKTGPGTSFELSPETATLEETGVWSGLRCSAKWDRTPAVTDSIPDRLGPVLKVACRR